VNTRSKIVTPDAVAGLDPARPLLLVAGYFDILQVELVRELAQARQRTGALTLVAAVLPLDGERVPLAERAEMTAALRVVDYVLTIETEDLDRLAASLQPIETIRLEEADRRRARQLIEHVQRRQSC
jgi:bifunctional ADP-heptose synthase (sugar kinase/adenylyltransferase)